MPGPQQRPARNNHFQLGRAVRLLKVAVTVLLVTGTGASGVGSIVTAQPASGPSRGAEPRLPLRASELTSSSMLTKTMAELAAGPVPGSTQPDPTSAIAPAPAAVGLPFAVPSKATLQSSAHKVFAHYIPSLPISLDNEPAGSDYYARNYLAPAGEGLLHVAYGGFLRDRPLGRAVLPGDWRTQDMQSDVRQAISAGIDGFDVDILQLPTTGSRLWANTITLLQAAAAVDPKFKIVLTPDMNSVRDATVAQWASALNTLSKYPSAYRLADGRLVLAPFMAEARTPAWWKSVIDTLSASYGIRVAFVPIFLDDQKYRATFASISYGMSNWGARNPASNNADVTYSTSPIGRANAVQGMGKIWMQPVSVQDERPSSGSFEEAENTQNLRNTWKIALDSGADWVNLTTWNDYSEGSAFAPSQKHGWTYLDINAYYLAQFKTGTAPKITRDAVYLTHRTQAAAARVTGPESMLMRLAAGSPARDTVEALTFLTAPATVNITVGSKVASCPVDAGVDTCTVPLGTGSVKAVVVRSGVAVATDNDPYPVTATPYAQDLQYVASGSMSSNGGGGNPAPAPASAVQTVALTPIADTFANAGAPNSSFGTSWSMSSRGNIGATSYLRFAIPAAPAGRHLSGAVLQVTTTTEGSAGSSQAHQVSLAGNSWNESTLNWNNRPALSTQLGTLASAPQLNHPYLVALNPAGIPSVATQLTLAISSTGTDTLNLWTSNHALAGPRPHLILTYK
jgi:Glycosyl hydrolase family 71